MDWITYLSILAILVVIVASIRNKDGDKYEIPCFFKRK